MFCLSETKSAEDLKLCVQLYAGHTTEVVKHIEQYPKKVCMKKTVVNLIYVTLVTIVHKQTVAFISGILSSLNWVSGHA